MKKILALILSAAMACGLTACGRETASGEMSSEQEEQSDTSSARINTAVDEPGQGREDTGGFRPVLQQ